MLLQEIFPSLFKESIALASVYKEVTVTKVPLNPNTVLIKVNGKADAGVMHIAAEQWFIDYLWLKNPDTEALHDYTSIYHGDGTVQFTDKL